MSQAKAIYLHKYVTASKARKLIVTQIMRHLNLKLEFVCIRYRTSRYNTTGVGVRSTPTYCTITTYVLFFTPM